MKKPALLLCAILTLLVFPAHAAMIVNDHFDGDSLSSSWAVSYAWGATGWDYAVTDGQLSVYEIDDTSLWGVANLTQEFDPIDDFEAEFQFSWSEESITEKRVFGIILLDSDYNRISGIFGHDASTSRIGEIATVNDGSYTYHTDLTLPLEGSGTAKIVRENGVANYYWDDVLIQTETLLTQAAAFQLTFYGYDGGQLGEVDVDYVTLESGPEGPSATPEPGTMVLLGSALGLGALIKRRRKKRAA